MAVGETIRYTDFYYEDMRRRFAQFKALYMSWHTETNPEDPINALAEFMFWMKHSDSSKLDMGVSELYWYSLQLRASAVANGHLIGYDLHDDIAAQVYQLAKLTSLPTPPTSPILEGAQFATEGDADNDPAVFEANGDIDVAAATFDVYLDGDDVYIGHRTLQFNGCDFSAGVYAAWGSTYSFEYYDGGAVIATGEVKGWTSVGGSWSDGTLRLTQAGTVSWNVPVGMHRDETTWWRRWAKTTINSIEGYWVRFLHTGGGGVVAPAAVIGEADWYVNPLCIQGETVVEEIGTTTTEQWQRYLMSRSPYINASLSELLIGTDSSWVEIDPHEFLVYGPEDKIFWIREYQDGHYVCFGDGTNGKIPPDSLTIQARYRIGASEDGNVGAGTVVNNRSGTPRLTDVTNPQAAFGWMAAEGSTDASMAQLRERAPASVRANLRAVSLEDHETLAIRFETSDGRVPVARAYAIANGAGQRSVRLLVVGPAGAQVSTSDLLELDTYFNGGYQGTQRVEGVAMQNATVVVGTGAFGAAPSVGYTPKTINEIANFEVLAQFASGAQALAEAALEAILSPLAVEADGNTWVWRPGGLVDDARLQAAIVAAVPGFVRFTVPPIGSTLAAWELTDPGTFTVTVTPV